MEENTLRGISVAEGIAALIFGIAAVFWPELTIVTLLYLFATFILVSGIINLVRGIFQVSQGVGSWFLKVLLAVLQIGVGVYLLRHPHVTFATFILLIGFSLIFRGIFEVIIAFMDGLSSGSRAMLVITGMLGVLVGIIILLQPVSGGITFVWILGIYALIIGPVTIASAMGEHHTTDRVAAGKRS